MKKLYYLLGLLPLLSIVTSCDDGPETVILQQETKPLTVTGVTPEQGYIGGQFTVTGTEFGGSKEILKVFIGDFEGKIISCSDTKIVAEVPEEAVSGKIIVELAAKKMDTGLTFSVLDYPVVSTETLEGYLNSELVFTGTNMPVEADYFTVKFGDVKAEITAYVTDEAGNGTITVKVPKELPVGLVDITVEMLNRKIFKKKYRVLASPVIDMLDKALLARPGSIITLTGTGLAGFDGKVKVNFNETPASPLSVTENSITVQIPDAFNGGKVSVEIEGFLTTELGEIQLVGIGDITNKVLKNYAKPFTANSSFLDGWSFNDKFTDSALETGSGLMYIQCGWGKTIKENAKVYQTAILPHGKYKFAVTVVECGNNNGGKNFGVIFAVTKGNATIPDLVEKNSAWILSDTGDVLASYRVSDESIGGGNTREYFVEVDLQESTEVTMGFVAQISGQGWAKFSSIKVALVE